MLSQPPPRNDTLAVSPRFPLALGARAHHAERVTLFKGSTVSAAIAFDGPVDFFLVRSKRLAVSMQTP